MCVHAYAPANALQYAYGECDARAHTCVLSGDGFGYDDDDVGGGVLATARTRRTVLTYIEGYFGADSRRRDSVPSASHARQRPKSPPTTSPSLFTPVHSNPEATGRTLYTRDRRNSRLPLSILQHHRRRKVVARKMLSEQRAKTERKSKKKAIN